MDRSHWAGVGTALLIAFALAAVTGCAGQTDLEQVQREQFRLRGMIASENQRVQSLEEQIRREQDEIDELKHTEGGGGEAANTRLASVQDRLNKLEAGLNALRASPPAPAPGAVPASPGAPAAAAPAPMPVQAWQADLEKELQDAKSISGAGAKVYREGLNAMKDGNYSVAVAKFAHLQKRYPKSPLVEDGEYFSANALFELSKYDQSILQFNDLVMRYPKGRFACSGLLREAQAFQKLNDKIDARLTAQKLISDCGGTAEAAAANALMKDLQN